MAYAILVIITCLVVWVAAGYIVWQAFVNYKRQQMRNKVRGYYIIR